MTYDPYIISRHIKQLDRLTAAILTTNNSKDYNAKLLATEAVLFEPPAGELTREQWRVILDYIDNFRYLHPHYFSPANPGIITVRLDR